MSEPPGLVPIWSQYSDTPVPLLQQNLTEDEVNVEPGGGLIMSALAGPISFVGN